MLIVDSRPNGKDLDKLYGLHSQISLISTKDVEARAKELTDMVIRCCNARIASKPIEKDDVAGARARFAEAARKELEEIEKS